MTRVDRAEELSRLEQTHTGQADQILIVTGETGMGKTFLLELAAREFDGAVLVRANPAERAWEYSGVSAMLAAIDDPQAQLLTSDLAWAESDGAFAAARSLLAHLVKMRFPSTTVMIDDVDVMDQSSQALLGFLARRLHGVGLRFILGMNFVDPSGPFGSLPHLSLTGMDLVQSVELATRIAKPGTDPATIQIVANIAAGVPAYLREGLEALTEAERQGRDPLAYPLQFGPRAATAARALFAGQSEESRAALKLVSTAPAHHELAVRELLGAQQSAIDDLLAQRVLVRTGEYLAMRQAVLRCAIYISLAAVNRQELHSQLHKMHRKHGSSLAQWHSSFLHDGEVSPRMLLETGLHLVRQGSGGLATAFADRAILLLSFEAEELADLLCALGSAMVDMGELAYAERYLRKANELVRGDAAVIVATLHQQIRSEFMRSHELDSQYIPSAMRQFGAQAPGLCVQLLSMVAVFHGERWEVDEAQQMLNLALPLLPQVNPAVAFEFEIASAWVGALTGDYRAVDRVSDVAARAEQGLISPLFAILLARSWTYAERYEQARMLFESLLSRSPTLDPLWLETARFFQAENEIRSGHFRRAVKCIETLHASSDVQQFHVNYLTSMRAWYWLAQNELARAQPFIDAVFKDASGSRNSINASRISALLGRSALSRADFSTALRHLLRVRESEASKLNPSFLRYEADLIEVLVAMGRFAEAKRFLADFELLARKTPSSWAANAISRCRALVASGDFSLDLFRQAIKIGRELATDYEQGRTVLCFAERLQELGYLSQSDQQRIKAKTLFDELSAPAWPERHWGAAEGKKNSRLKRFGKASPPSSIEVRQLALPVSAAANSLNPTSAVTQRVLEGAELTASLTNGERQVVVHVLAGLRNKEIAALLEVSLRTVETRLTNVYKKTGASSRAHLVSLASETR